MSGAHLSKDFYDLVRAIGESKSKQEEDRIITREVQVLKARFAEKGLSKKVIKECLIRVIYVEMLGHDASFAYVHAIQLTAAGDLMQKRVGYLCAALTLSPDHDFRFMLVNQLQRDLQSANVLDVSSALVAVCKLITEEMIPAVLPNVAPLLKHDQSLVRKKAAMAIHRMHQLNPQSVSYLTDDFRRLLCDKDPAVMNASLCLLYELAKKNPQANKDLVPSYVSVLKQLSDHNIPSDFVYHHIPAPWIQIKLLRILAVLGRNDQRMSEGMYEVLKEVQNRAKNISSPVAYAVVYEFVRTVTAIYPNPKLLDIAADAISQFIKSNNHNLKYLGVTGLAAIVQDHPRYAADHQMIVLDCLDDPDETLKRKTLELLFRMTNPINAEVVVDKLLHFLEQAMDKFLRRDLVSRITQLAERYSPDNLWYVRTMTKVFELGGDLVEVEVAHNLLRLLAEGGVDGVDDEEAEEANQEMRREACLLFIELLEKPVLPEILHKVMFWTLGEYCYLVGKNKMLETILALTAISEREDINVDARGYALSAIMKMCAQIGHVPKLTMELIEKACTSLGTDLQQRSYEFKEMQKIPGLLSHVLPVDASCEDLSDADFSFLDSYAAEMRMQGAPEYMPPGSGSEDDLDDSDSDDDAKKKKDNGSDLRFDAYEKPTLPTTYAPSTAIAASPAAESINVSHNTPSTGLNTQGVKNVWGADGYAGSVGVQKIESQQKPKPKEPPTAYARPDGYNPNIPTQTATAATPVQDSSTNSNIGAKPAVVPTEPPKPKELTEREKMAAALFGGVSSNKEATSRRPVSRRSAQAKPSVRSQPEDTSSVPSLTPATQPVDDLLGLDFSSSTSAPEQAHVSTTATPSSSVDLLSALDPMTVSETATTYPYSHDNLLDSLSTNTPSGNGNLNGVGAGPLETMFAPLSSFSTNEFGQNWVGLTSEQRLAIANPNMCDFFTFTSILASTLNFAKVEVIADTQEAIFAGRPSDSTSEILLIHSKQRPSFSPPVVDITVRTSSVAATSKLSSYLQQHF